MTQASTKTPPQAPRRPHAFTTHGIAVSDDYAWLKDANWQEVLHDPSVLDKDIRADTFNAFAPFRDDAGGETHDHEHEDDLNGDSDHAQSTA